jgi:hypothetical protein
VYDASSAIWTTADGSVLQVWGNKRISALSNGVFCHVDNGAEPDFTISRLEHFYDRKKLTEYINNLY